MSRTTANSIMKAITDFEFIITLFIMKGFLSYLNTISKTLQSVQIDLITASEEIKDTIDFFKAVRLNIDVYYESIYKDCIAQCEIVEIIPHKPRTCGRQTNRMNNPSSSPNEYYKNNFAIPLVDHIIR